MRREGVYSSLLSNWRKQGSASPAKRGRPANPEAAENARLRKENERLERKLAKAEHTRGKKSARALADDRRREHRGRGAIEPVVTELADAIGARAACTVLGISRATMYRRAAPVPTLPLQRARRSPRRLSDAERQTLLDAGCYRASISTWYRALHAAAGETRERRRQATHPARVKPELAQFAIGRKKQTISRPCESSRCAV